jgi:hypothetical protein
MGAGVDPPRVALGPSGFQPGTLLVELGIHERAHVDRDPGAHARPYRSATRTGTRARTRAPTDPRSNDCPPGSRTPASAFRAPHPAAGPEGRDGGDGIRTRDLKVMSLPSYQLLHSAMLPPGVAPGNSCYSGRRLCCSPREARRDASSGIRTRDLQRDRLAGTLGFPMEAWLQGDRPPRSCTPLARFGGVRGPGPRPVSGERTTGVAPVPRPRGGHVLLLNTTSAGIETRRRAEHPAR